MKKFALLMGFALLIGCATHVQKGKQALREDNLDTAKTHLKNSLDEHPENLDARLALARVHLQNNDPQKAKTVLKQANNRKSNQPLVSFLLGVTERKLNNPENARKQFTSVLNQEPDQDLKVQAYHNRGLTALQNEDFSSAESDFRSALDLKKTARSYILLSVLHFRNNDYKQAISASRAATSVSKDTFMAYFIRIAAQNKRGDSDAARKTQQTLDRLLNDEQNREPYFRLAGQFLGKQQMKQLKHRLTNARERVRKRTKLVKKATRYIPGGQYDRAIETLTRAIEVDNRYPPTYKLRAEARIRAGNIAGATEDLKRAHELNSDFMTPVFSDASSDRILETAKAKIDYEKFEQAIVALHQLPDHQTSTEAQVQLGRAYYRLERDQQAQQHLSNALQTNSSHHQARLLTGRIYLRNQRFNKAVDAYSRILEDQPNHNRALRERAAAHRLLGNAEREIADLRAYLDQNPKNEWVMVFLGQRMINNGDYEDAISVLKKATSLNEERARTHYLLARAYAQRYNQTSGNDQSKAEAFKEQTYKQLTGAFDSGFHRFEDVRNHSAFRSLRDSEQFSRIVTNYSDRIEVSHGYLNNATVCVDANFNSQCDSGEGGSDSSDSEEEGAFSINTDGENLNAPTLVKTEKGTTIDVTATSDTPPAKQIDPSGDSKIAKTLQNTLNKIGDNTKISDALPGVNDQQAKQLKNQMKETGMNLLENGKIFVRTDGKQTGMTIKNNGKTMKMVLPAGAVSQQNRSKAGIVHTDTPSVSTIAETQKQADQIAGTAMTAHETAHASNVDQQLADSKGTEQQEKIAQKIEAGTVVAEAENTMQNAEQFTSRANSTSSTSPENGDGNTEDDSGTTSSSTSDKAAPSTTDQTNTSGDRNGLESGSDSNTYYKAFLQSLRWDVSKIQKLSSFTFPNGNIEAFEAVLTSLQTSDSPLLNDSEFAKSVDNILSSIQETLDRKIINLELLESFKNALQQETNNILENTSGIDDSISSFLQEDPSRMKPSSQSPPSKSLPDNLLNTHRTNERDSSTALHSTTTDSPQQTTQNPVNSSNATQASNNGSSDGSGSDSTDCESSCCPQ